jgi:hypothetical protein
MNLHDEDATLTVDPHRDGAVSISINQKRAVQLRSGEKCYYGASITLTIRQLRRLACELNRLGHLPEETRLHLREALDQNAVRAFQAAASRNRT